MPQSHASSSAAALTSRRMVPDPSSRTATFAFADDLDRPLLAVQRLSSLLAKSTSAPSPTSDYLTLSMPAAARDPTLDLGFQYG